MANGRFFFHEMRSPIELLLAIDTDRAVHQTVFLNGTDD